MRAKLFPFCFLLVLILLTGCKPTADKDHYPKEQVTFPQISIIQVEILNNKGAKIPVVIKFNALSGETWFLKNADTLEWIPIGSQNDPLGILRASRPPLDSFIRK